MLPQGILRGQYLQPAGRLACSNTGYITAS